MRSWFLIFVILPLISFSADNGDRTCKALLLATGQGALKISTKRDLKRRFSDIKNNFQILHKAIQEQGQELERVLAQADHLRTGKSKLAAIHFLEEKEIGLQQKNGQLQAEVEIFTVDCNNVLNDLRRFGSARWSQRWAEKIRVYSSSSLRRDLPSLDLIENIQTQLEEAVLVEDIANSVSVHKLSFVPLFEAIDQRKSARQIDRNKIIEHWEEFSALLKSLVREHYNDDLVIRAHVEAGLLLKKLDAIQGGAGEFERPLIQDIRQEIQLAQNLLSLFYVRRMAGIIPRKKEEFANFVQLYEDIVRGFSEQLGSARAYHEAVRQETGRSGKDSEQTLDHLKKLVGLTEAYSHNMNPLELIAFSKERLGSARKARSAFHKILYRGQAFASAEALLRRMEVLDTLEADAIISEGIENEREHWELEAQKILAERRPGDLPER